MDLHEYTYKAMQTAVFPKQPLDPAIYLALGLAEEAGEVAGVVKKHIRNTPEGVMPNFLDPEVRVKLKDEMGDVFWYLVNLCDALGFDPVDVLRGNLEKLATRKAGGTLKVRLDSHSTLSDEDREKLRQVIKNLYVGGGYVPEPAKGELLKENDE